MSAIAVDISEFTVKIKDLITSLKSDEEIIITDADQPVARLIVIDRQSNGQHAPATKRRRAGTAEGTFWMSPDFNEPLEEFSK